MADNLFTQKVVCRGGLIINTSDLELSDNQPGAATELVNFEPSLFGGYRKINGYTPWSATFPEVDPLNATGKILCVAALNGNLIVARAASTGSVYNFYYLDVDLGWTAYTTGLTLSSTGVNKIRFDLYNFADKDKIIFVDGVNKPVVFDGTSWFQIDSASTGTEISPGGAQALNAPKFVKVFRNTIFLAGDGVAPSAVAYSAPSKDYDWTSASGAGQLITGFVCNGMWPFRDTNYIFGEHRIKKVELDSSLNFVINDVTTNIGCIAPDSINEIGGDLIFLAQDGFRPISGTSKIGDVQLETVSKQIQYLAKYLIESSSLTDICSVLVRGKSQIRFFFSNSSIENANARGIIGAIRDNNGSYAYEWGELKGIRVSCTYSFYSGSTEYVVHGDYDGKVHRQELGNSFDGDPIQAIYSTPFLDLGDTGKRKTFRKVSLFIRPEGNANINTNVIYDWDDENKLNPSAYTDPISEINNTYGVGIYDVSLYSGASTPFIMNNIEGSGFSVKFIFSDYTTDASYSLQAFLFDFSAEGRK